VQLTENDGVEVEPVKCLKGTCVVTGHEVFLSFTPI